MSFGKGTLRFHEIIDKIDEFSGPFAKMLIKWSVPFVGSSLRNLSF
jgi:hypothetical protein